MYDYSWEILGARPGNVLARAINATRLPGPLSPRALFLQRLKARSALQPGRAKEIAANPAAVAALIGAMPPPRMPTHRYPVAPAMVPPPPPSSSSPSGYPDGGGQPMSADDAQALQDLLQAQALMQAEQALAPDGGVPQVDVFGARLSSPRFHLAARR